MESQIYRFIRDRKGHKVGIIEAHKLTEADQDIFEEPIVLIVHSKCNTKVDVFDELQGFDVNMGKMMYMLKALRDKQSIRDKKSNQKPNKALRKIYDEMTDRAVRYFKDVTKFYVYTDLFNYAPERSEATEKLKFVEDPFNYSYKEYYSGCGKCANTEPCQVDARN